MTQIRYDPVRRFWSYVQTTDNCWLWTGLHNKFGYGRFWNGQREMPAHRYAWELMYSPAPADLFVCHHCDNRECVRPDHLFLGTAADNMADKTRKGRQTHTGPGNPARGTRNVNAKLTDEAIREIRARYAAGGISQLALAAEYGVTQTTVSMIVLNRSWRHVASSCD